MCVCVHLCVKMKRPQGHSTALRAVEEQLDGFNGLIANATIKFVSPPFVGS